MPSLGPRTRIALSAGAAVLVALAVASQLVLPGVAERRIENRLTEGGGTADASMSAFPAVRLLFDDGARFEVEGEGLDLDVPEERIDLLTRLDGFGDVDVMLQDSEAGPFELALFSLTREGDGPYTMRTIATTSGTDLISFGADRFGFSAAAPILGFLAGRSEEATRRIPIDMDMEMVSEDGRLRVTDGGGTVAGYPTGPLAELIVATIVERL